MQMYDVIVIGAGIAGASTACAMAARGWNTLLLDRHSFPRHKVCGEFLSPESARSLTSLGLAHVLEGQTPPPEPIERIRLAAAFGKPLELRLQTPAQSISRYALDYALQQEADRRGAVVRTGVTVRGMARIADGWRVSIRSREHGETELMARVVIGAWGRNAPAEWMEAGVELPLTNDAVEALGGDGESDRLRVGAGAFRRGGLSRQDKQPSDVQADWRGKVSGGSGNEGGGGNGRGKRLLGVRTLLSGVPAEPVVELFFFRGGYLGLVPAGDGTANAAALVTPEAFTAAGQSAAAVLDAAAQQVPALARRLRDAQPVAGTTAATPVVLTREPRAWGIVPHVGDAASVIPPLCGDGMAMGLHAAALCAPLADQYLRSSISLQEWRMAYTGALQRDFAGPLRWGLRLQAGLGSRALSGVLLGLGRLVPSMAYRLVEATRLQLH
ncbi:FAD-dependent monooxygenase [Paenibacillus sp. PR3]|uniref:FAD-dependent monooxygenase n=1 Tax=Paenibacillus terricola TaxID=2763503 RepID=A0ABR8N3Z0_9BACL|nr:FAD-dependent oxidoreductase [Paenibacillus terricola]MBD3922117.1 FAD-dependent monooxygenase [Paenibacillus terricola]